MAWLNMEINKAVLCAHMERNSSLPLQIQEPPPPRTTKLLSHLTIMQMNAYICCIRTLPPKKRKRGDVHRQGLLWFLYIYTHVHTSLFSHDCPGVCFILLQNIILHPRLSVYLEHCLVPKTFLYHLNHFTKFETMLQSKMKYIGYFKD